MPPSNQSKRPISFVLRGSGGVTKFPMTIRPEELTRTDTSRTNVHQTLGGAWADCFGAGLPTIQISGVTGWGQGGLPDGQKVFQALFDTVFKKWHADRLQAVQGGRDPDTVKLIFVDALDNFSGVVIPNQFTLKRSKSRPLLSQYMINMTMIAEDMASPSFGGISILSAIESFRSGLAKIIDFVKGVIGSVLGPITAVVADFTNLTANVLGLVKDVVGGALSIADSVYLPLMNIAGNLSRAAANVMSMVRTVVALPQIIKAKVARVESAFENAACIISNIFAKRQFMANYDSIYGASTCSSTAGGRPISKYDTENPFIELFPISGTQQQYTPAALSAVDALAKADVVLSPMSADTMSGYMQSIVAGIAV